MLLLRLAYCLTALLLGLGLGACSYLGLESKRIDYKSAGKLAPLEVPPDLLRPSADDRYVIPDVGSRGSATYSEYSRERSGAAVSPGASMVLPQQDGARIVRDGSQRWLVVKGAPDQVWPAVKTFWQELGFIVNIEVPESGVMETDWAENRARVDAGVIRNLLGRVLDLAYSSSERDKFRTRLERGAEPGTTEIYISHRGMEEVYVGTSSESLDTRWQPRPPNPSLEAEMLGRLMVRLGTEEARAKAQLASGGARIPDRATLSQGPDGVRMLALEEPFDRAWRRVGLALDRVGFTVEDRDRSKGIYFVRYIDPQIDGGRAADKPRGFLSRLKFWGDSQPKQLEQFRIEVKDAPQGARITVFNKDGAQENSDTAGKILVLLYEQLR